MKNKLFELIHKNWSLRASFEWESTKWIIYEDLSVERTDYYGDIEMIAPMKKVTYISEKQMNKIKDLIEKSKKIQLNVSGCDGDAWEFILYENNKIKWKRKLGYIYGIKPLEVLTKMFEKDF